MKTSALASIIAASLRHNIGRDAAQKLCLKTGGNLKLFRLACQLEAAQGV